MVDGNIQDFINLAITPEVIGEGVNLYTYQDKHYVWFAYDYPNDSYGTLDLKIISPNEPDTVNLHVSAQLGEWYLNEGSPKPENSTSELWWNHKGWTANEVWMNGMDQSDVTPRPNFKSGAAREIQLSKKRFGRGEWKINMNIRMLKGADGEMFSVDYPSNDAMLTIQAN